MQDARLWGRVKNAWGVLLDRVLDGMRLNQHLERVQRQRLPKRIILVRHGESQVLSAECCPSPLIHSSHAWARHRLATSICQPRHDQMEQGPTAPSCHFWVGFHTL